LAFLLLNIQTDIYSANDPYQGMRYNDAFNQAAIYDKYKDLLFQMGCAHNVLEQSTDVLVADLSEEEYAKKLQAFEKECLSLLNKARFVPLFKPAVASLLSTTLKVGVFAAAFMYMKKNDNQIISMVGNVYGSLFQVMGMISISQELVQVAHNFISLPDNSLGYLEEYFAKNKCYIPQVLWPKIIEGFVLAREHQCPTTFLNFILNFTVYKPKDSGIVKRSDLIFDIKNKLRERIKDFFKGYQDFDKESLSFIQINVEKFVDELINGHTSQFSHGPRYIYLHGVGGIGKTHFVQTLAAWLEELIPDSVLFEDLVINSAIELEGNEQMPGALLKVLRNQLMRNKRGSIIMFDEASWLNDANMISSVKRVFNGDRSKLSSAFFGTNIDGSMISFSIPPMLIFVAGNDTIHDAALASRFDLVSYPIPTKESLFNYALSIIHESKIMKNYSVIIDNDKIYEWIQGLKDSDCNFRYIASRIEGFLLRNI
jgi:hypothetical protein